MLPIEGDRDGDPYVLKLTPQNEGHNIPTDSRGELAPGLSTGRTSIVSPHGVIEVSGISAHDLVSDVVLVHPRRRTLERLIRASSNDNTLLITERCDQLCVMCSQPPKTKHEDRFAHFRQALLLSEPHKTIGMSGGEPMLYLSDIANLIAFASDRRPDLFFHVLTNGQHFTRATPREQRVLSKPNVLWGVPVYSENADTHDEIVGLEGAFDTLCHNLALLCTLGASVELRTVLMRPNILALPALASFIARRLEWARVWAIMQLERAGFARSKWKTLFHDHGPDPSGLVRAVSIAAAFGVDVRLYNFPRCTVPSAIRDRCDKTISDWKRRYLPPCEECAEADLCSGVFEWYRPEDGFEGVHPL